MKFENKGKWFKESAGSNLIDDEELALDEEAEDDFSDLLAEDELDVVDDDEQPMNEVRYIDPKNLDKYEPDEIEEVTDAQGNKRYKRSGNTGAGRNAQGSYQKKTDAKQGFNQDLANSLLNYGQEDYDEFMNIANQMDPDEYPNDFRRAVARNTNIPDKVAMDFIDAYDYNDMDKWKNAKTQQVPAQNRSVDSTSNNTKVTNDTEEVKKFSKEEESLLNEVLSNSLNKFNDIPNRNKDPRNAFKNATEVQNDIYNSAGISLFSKSIPNDPYSNMLVTSLIDSGLDGAFVDWVKSHVQETPKTYEALKKLDSALQKKDTSNARIAYKELWNANKTAQKVQGYKNKINNLQRDIASLDTNSKKYIKLSNDINKNKEKLLNLLTSN